MNIDHYVVHATVPDAPQQATYGTSAPHKTLSGAMSDALSRLHAQRRVFVTARDRNANILLLMPVVDYPEVNTHVPDEAQQTITQFIEDMDWSS